MEIIYTIDEVPVDRYITEIKGTTIINTLVHNHIDVVSLDITPLQTNDEIRREYV